MTTDKAKKQAVRARMEQTGETYTEALRHALTNDSSKLGHLFRDDHCASCRAELEESNQTLFCNEFCKQVADFVRYSRAVSSDPARANDPEVREIIRIKMAMLIGGGYPERARRLTVAQRRAIIDKDNGLCRRCGAPANQIDHIAGSSSDEPNLQLLCDKCHNDKTTSTFIPASEEQRAWAKELWDTRVFSEHPLRLCDDSTRWKEEWRALKAQRIERLWRQLEEETGIQRVDYRGMKWEDVLDDAYDSNVLPGEDLVDVWEDINQGSGSRKGTEEEIEEAWYLRTQMEKDD